MAFFKFRKAGDDQTKPVAQPESVEMLRRRAKNRLIGSAILVLIGVVGFPLLVDQQPRPVAVDLPIEIPDKNKVLPLTVPAAATEAAPVATAAASGLVTETLPPAAKPVPASKPEPKAPPKAEAKKPDTKAVAATEARYVVQVGSFADENRVREARKKIERAGFKSFTQAVETKDGKRTRVRAGPFASKTEAERAAEKLKQVELPGTVLSL